MGRPSTFTEAKAAEIIDRISAGEPLAQICRDDAMPQLRTVYNWLEADAELSARFARAREAGHDMIAADALTIADQMPPSTERGTDSGFVSWQKNRIWTRMQLLAKWDPKRYGERMNVAGVDDSPLTVVVQKFTEGPK